MSFTDLLALFEKGEFREILNYADDQESLVQNDPLAAQVVAAAYFQTSNYIKASEILTVHEASLGSDVSFLSLFGATSRRLGQLNKARELFLRALDIEPESSTVRNNYANLLIDLGEFDEARNILEALLVDNPSYEDAVNNLKRLLSRQVESPKSDDLNTAKSFDSDFQSWHPSDPLMLAFAEEEVQHAGAINFSKPKSQSAMELASKLPNPDQVSLAEDQIKLATRSIQEGNPSFALQLLSKAALTLGAHPVIYINAGDAYILLKRFHEAEMCFLNALQIGGPSLPAFLNLATLANVRSDLGLARFYLDSCSAVDPNHPNLASIRNAILDSEGNSKPNNHHVFPDKWVLPELNQQTS